MDADRWARIKPIFYEAAEQPVDERGAFIKSRCDGDGSLAREIETLLAAHDQANSFIDHPAAGQEQTPTLPLAENSNPHIGPYRVIREIGSGGMGSVYLAERADGQYMKKVAIKLIKQGLDNDFIIQRLRNERQILANLEHNNIARLLDGGATQGGLPYLVMEYIDGEPINRYCDTRTLPTSDRLRLFRAVCSAVHYAHQKHVVHRDIKPGNILVTPDGTPKLLDFGIAKLLAADLSLDPTDATATAVRLMTPEYASPEQIRGEAITPSTDVYSLGVLLYELMTGRRPYRLKNRQSYEIARMICEEEPEKPSSVVTRTEEITTGDGRRVTLTPESVSKTRDGEPKKLRKALENGVDSIVLMSLRKEPEQRYASAEEFSEDIRRYLEGRPIGAQSRSRRDTFSKASRSKPVATLLIISFVVLVLIGLLVYFLRPRQPISSGAARSIAVLPFKNLSAETADEYSGLGMADALITKLSNIGNITIRPTSAILKYGSAGQDSVSVGRELSVDAVLDGTFQKSGDKIRVSVQLVRVSDGTSLWAYKRDYQSTDIFDLQDSISEQAAHALQLQLTSEETKLLAKRFTENSEAYEAYVKGRYFWGKRTAAGTEKAIDWFHIATEKDPRYALAYSGLADAYTVLSEYERVDRNQMSGRAHEAARVALELDDALAEAHSSFGWISLIFDWDLRTAERELRRSIDLNPNYPIARQFYSVLLTATGRFDEALAERQRGEELDPLSLALKSDAGRGCYFARRYDQAISHSRSGLEIDPNFAGGHLWIGLSYEQKGMLDQAGIELKQALALGPRRTEMMGALGHLYAVAGQTREAERTLSELEGGSAEDQLAAYFIAVIYAALGRHERALGFLETSFQERSPFLLLRMGVDPRLDPLRKDPRFEELMRRAGLLH